MGVRPVYSKVYTMASMRGKGRKRVSQEDWPKGLGHWDTPLHRPETAIGGSVCLQGSSRAQEPLSRPLSCPIGFAVPPSDVRQCQHLDTWRLSEFSRTRCKDVVHWRRSLCSHNHST